MNTAALRGGFFMHARTLYATENSRTMWHDHGDGTVTIQKVADVTNAVERAKELHNMGAHTTGMGDKHAASIPVAALESWLQKRGKTFADWSQDQQLVKQFLEDPENGVFRIWKGRL